MDYFSVNYQGMAEVMQTEQQLSKKLDNLASRLLKCNAKATMIGSLRDKDYHKKIWKLCANTGNRQTDVYRMKQGLMKVSDAYRAYEGKVLQQAEEIVTAKNGFSKKTVKHVKNTVDSYGTYAKEHQLVKEQTVGGFLYDNTIGQWKENWILCGDAVESIKEVRKDIGESLYTNLRGWMEENGADEAVIAGLDKLAEKADDYCSLREDILLGILHCGDKEAVKTGIVSYVSEMTGGTDYEAIGKLLEGAADGEISAEKILSGGADYSGMDTLDEGVSMLGEFAKWLEENGR